MTEREQSRSVMADRAQVARDDHDAWALAESMASDGLWYWDVSRGFIRVSPRTEELLGYGLGELGRRPTEVLRHVDAADVSMLRSMLRTLVVGRRTRLDAEIRVLTRAGERRWVHVRGRARRDTDGRVRYIAGAITDVDARKTVEEQLRHETRHDPLTRLPNRTALMSCLTARIARAATVPEPGFAVLYVDLDHFKPVNDTLGHACGDAVLAAAADRLADVIGPDDLLARVGGDEFVAVIDAVANAEAMSAVADRLHQALAAPIRVRDDEAFVSASVGARLGSQDQCKPSELIRDADIAMYHAKRAGGARTAVYDRAMHESTARRYAMQQDLQQALHTDELRLAYQPIFDVREHRLCGFEVLLRWDHPTRGTLHAQSFVNEANESGLIVQLGRWVLRESCRQLADWAGAYPGCAEVGVSVNLCDRELLDPEFARFVTRTLEETGVPASRLTLEMSEGAITNRFEAIVPVLEQLRGMGVQLQLDGFGSGRSSLGMLRRLPITAIKIDREVIRDVARDEERRALAATIINYATALGLGVTAEGVETQAQVRALATLGGCRYVQGHLFSSPVPAPEAEALLDEAPVA